MTATAEGEPDSVILRDPVGKVKLPSGAGTKLPQRPGLAGAPALDERRQNHRFFYFSYQQANKPQIRLTVPREKSSAAATSAGGQNQTQPIIEVDGKLQFSPARRAALSGAWRQHRSSNPTLAWKLKSKSADTKLDAEVPYVTGGLSPWHARDYNIV